MSALPAEGRCAILDGMEARAGEVFVGRIRELGSSGARSRRRATGRARPSSLRGKRASARPGSRPSWRGMPATRGSRSSWAARSISSARSSRTSRSSRPCVRSGSPGRSRGRGPVPSRRYSRTRSRCFLTGSAAPVLLVLEDLHWPEPRRSTSSSSSPRPRRPAGGPARDLRGDEPLSAERMRRLADEVRRSGLALVLALGPFDSRRAGDVPCGSRRPFICPRR